jgi:hypothetical protein
VAIVTRYVPGGTLRAALRDADGPFDFATAAGVLRDLAAALAHAHTRRLVHRDVKPENVFIERPSGRALLADFGIARPLDVDSPLTVDGSALGTPTYMAPEQITGRPIDERTDVYALGLVGWEMLAGRRPWHGETLYSVLHRQQHDELPDLALLRPDIPAYLLAAVRGALAKNPDGRWRDGPEFLERLTPAPVALPAAPDLPDDASVVRADQTVRLAPTTTQPIDVGRAKSTGTRRLARRRRLAAAAAAVAVLGIGGAVVAQRQSAAAQRARDAAVTGVSDAQLDSLLRAAAAAAPFGGARAAPPRRPAAPATPAARTRAGQTGSTSPVPPPARRPDPGAAVRAAAAPVSTPVAALPPATAPDPPDATNATLAQTPAAAGARRRPTRTSAPACSPRSRSGTPVSRATTRHSSPNFGDRPGESVSRRPWPRSVPSSGRGSTRATGSAAAPSPAATGRGGAPRGRRASPRCPSGARPSCAPAWPGLAGTTRRERAGGGVTSRPRRAGVAPAQRQGRRQR